MPLCSFLKIPDAHEIWVFGEIDNRLYDVITKQSVSSKVLIKHYCIGQIYIMPFAIVCKECGKLF